MEMDSSQINLQENNELCEQCASVNFSSLFSLEMKAFQVGTLSSIVENNTCPFCRLISDAIKHSWMSSSGELQSSTDLRSDAMWVKTTFWAHCDLDTKLSHDYHAARIDKFRFRPTLGTDWKEEKDRKMWNGNSRTAICELDYVSTEQYFPFTDNLSVDRTQLLQRRLIPNVVDISLIQSWVEECQSNHNHLGHRAASQEDLRATRQFRVYDVIESNLIAPIGHVEYVALSYTWGDALRKRQLANPVSWWSELFDDGEQIQAKDQSRSVRFDKLPVTIQDASLLLQRLGWRYLWVDLLCVCQDDISKKELMINKMHLIYESASLTVVAAGGEHADSPLHGLRIGTRPSEKTWTIPTAKGKLNLVLARPELAKLLSSTLWTTRGWTFQEDTLSSCCLFFTKDEVFYSCDHHMPQRRLEGAGDYSGFGRGRFNEWREGYVLETKFTRSAYQSLSPWNQGWSKSLTRGLRCESAVIRQSNAEHLAIEDDLWCPRPPYQGPKKPNYFREYATLVGEYTRRNLTEPGDILGAFMGILCKFDTKLRIGPDVQFHGLLNSQSNSHDSSSSLLEMALLWVPSEANVLRRRCVKSRPLVVADRQFPSWAWSGWIGPIDYPLQDYSDPSSRAASLGSQQSGWSFSPATFAPKVGPLHMRRSFSWSRRGNRRIIAELLDTRKNCASSPKRGTDVRATCTLTLFTHVAKLGKSTEKSGFVAQKFQIWTDRGFLSIHSDHGKSSNGTAILLDSGLDSGTHSFKRKYKIACIGKGKRAPAESYEQSTVASNTTEWVVLLLGQNEDGYERIGLTTVLPDEFKWKLKWVDIV